MKITLPADYQPPDNAKPGESFEVVATIVQADDGSFDLTQIDGIPVEGEEKEEAGEVAPPQGLVSRLKMPWAPTEQPT
jgi:hypothetical protein